jgi:hypothetical protein
MSFRERLFCRYNDDTLHRLGTTTVQIAMVLGAAALLCLIFSSSHKILILPFVVLSFSMISVMWLSMMALSESKNRGLERIADMLIEHDVDPEILDSKETFEKWMREVD